MKLRDQIAIRVPREIKLKVRREARARMLDGADIVREALRFYFKQKDSKKSII
jgi:hypothetical protein